MPVGLQALEIASVFNRTLPELAPLYETLVERRHQPQQGNRNASLMEMIPFLYRAVGEPVLKMFVEYFYDVNQAIWTDSREQHLKEASALLCGVKQTYLDGLSPLESAYYARLATDFQDAFRICRDLAHLKSEELEAGCFFLSCNELGRRINRHPQKAQRILQNMIKFDLLEIVKKGERRACGARGEATVWRWLLSTPSSRQA